LDIDIDVIEEAEVVETFDALAGKDGTERVPLLELHFPTDDIILVCVLPSIPMWST